MFQPKWGMFFDFHTMPACPDVGKNFDAEAFASRLEKCGIDFVCFHARCNLGMAYYNTKIGTRHPTLKYDLLETLIEACGRHGIQVSAYMNVGLSHQEGLEHRDWMTVRPDGSMYQGDWVENNFFRRMCYNSGYADHMLAMAEEIVTNYKVSGLFLDCFLPAPCIGIECVEKMKQQGYDPTDTKEIRRFSVDSRNAFAARIAERIRKVRPDLLLYFNGVPFQDQQELGTYLEYEALGRSCYETMLPTVHYARKLGKTVMNMVGRFHRTWADFGGIRTVDSLMYELGIGVSNTLRCTVGDHFHPRGEMYEPVFQLVEKVYSNFRKFEPYLENAAAITEIGVLIPPETMDFSSAPQHQKRLSSYGVCMMLDELHQQYDVITPDMDFSDYTCLILPDEMRVDSVLAEKLAAYRKAGGKMIASYHSLLKTDSDTFALNNFPAVFISESPWNAAYMKLERNFCPEFPDMPIALYTSGASVASASGAHTVGRIIKPIYNRMWDGEHGFAYTPPDCETEEAALVEQDGIYYFSHPIFRDYQGNAYPIFRHLLGSVLNRIIPVPLISATGLPAYAKCTLTTQEGKNRLIHLMNYQASSPAKDLIVVEPPIPLSDVTLRLRTDGFQARRVFFADSGENIPFLAQGNILVISPARLNGYQVIAIE